MIARTGQGESVLDGCSRVISLSLLRVRKPAIFASVTTALRMIQIKKQVASAREQYLHVEQTCLDCDARRASCVPRSCTNAADLLDRARLPRSQTLTLLSRCSLDSLSMLDSLGVPCRESETKSVMKGAK